MPSPIEFYFDFASPGGRPIRDIPLRGPHMERDLSRFAAYLGVDFAVPAQWPIAALAPSRAFWWLADDEPKQAGARHRRRPL